MIDYMLDICMYYFFHVSMQLLQSLPSNSTATNLDQAIVTFKLTVFLMLFLLNRVYMCPCRLSSNIELFFLSNLILAYYIFIIILIMLSHRCPQFFKETKIFLPWFSFFLVLVRWATLVYLDSFLPNIMIKYYDHTSITFWLTIWICKVFAEYCLYSHLRVLYFWLVCFPICLYCHYYSV